MIVVDAALLAHYVGPAYISINPTLYYTLCQAPISRQYFNICLGLLPFIAHKRVLNSMRTTPNWCIFLIYSIVWDLGGLQ